MQKEIPFQIDGVLVDVIKPDIDLKEVGLDFYKITEDGLNIGYKHGYEKGLTYMNK